MFKTLKDLCEFDMCIIGKKNKPLKYKQTVTLDAHKLRQEAIKHIKSKIKHIESHSHKHFNWNGIYLNCLLCRNHFVQIKWIMYFFNVKTDEVV